MSFLVAPCRDFNGAVGVRIGVDDAGGFKRVDDAERPIEPAREILALKMRSGQQFRSGPCTRAEYVADAVDRSSKPRLGKPPGKPLQRAHMRFGKSRPVNAGLVGAEATERGEIRQDPGAIDAIFRHEAQP
ncbi:hypothetical protein GALL_515990 [mine drainage metagenome]|uniref:Uncharacterized protein n=1 Tax=mine drainage metagenome TaxID=410659 RepID=A0A1J5PNG5_9ZZZZ